MMLKRLGCITIIFFRALDIAVKHKTHVDTVLGFRERYMKKCNKKESNKKFLQFAQGVRNMY